MDTLIKAIRNELKFNQEQFAASLGTTVGTINRWENGKTMKYAIGLSSSLISAQTRLMMSIFKNLLFPLVLK